MATGAQVEGETTKCLRPGCEEPARTRGLCRADYYIAKRLVDHKKATWADLETRGRALARTRPRRPDTEQREAWLLGKAVYGKD